MPDTRTPLTGDAARKALKDIIESTKYAVGYSPEMAAALLATGQITVYAPEEPACVARTVHEIDGLYVDAPAEPGTVARVTARALHAAGLCACRADALLRRGESVVSQEWVEWRADTRAYLAERDR